ncbi:MAG TPA: hypothetical protein EYQ78_05395 [Candidatus Poseidoniales archaeon]|nr:hypothetical protein [Candidatus Poseidoniales archaeon]
MAAWSKRCGNCRKCWVIYEREIGSRKYMPDSALQTFEEIGRIPGRILRYLLSDNDTELVDRNSPFDERLRLIKREEKLICIRAGIYGVLCGISIVWITYLARHFEPSDLTADLKATAFYFAITIGSGIILTMIELFFIYVDTIKTARKIALISGLRPAIIDDDDVTDELIVSLMYAGLKAPNSHSPMYGINPREHVNKIVLIFSMAVHKSKVAISRIILKSLYRRVLVRLGGRTVSRAVIETASIPVFALWNFIAVRRVMKEIRIRVTLPLLMNDLQENLLPNGFDNLTKMQQKATLLAIKSQVTGVADFHPNIKLFVERIFAGSYHENEDVFENIDGNLEQILKSMSAEERRIPLRIFCAVCGMDGRLKRRVRAESKRLSILCTEYDKHSLKKWRDYFMHGTSIPT